MAEEEIGLRLALKNRREVVSGIDDVGDKLDRAGDEADRLNRKSRIAAGGMLSLSKSGRLAGRAMVYGIGGAATAVVGAGIALTKFSKDAIGEAREAQKVGAVTRAEIKATGGVANVTAKSMERLAGAISEKVGMDDEAIQSGANLLLTFKNVRNEAGKGNKVFDRATRAAVDLSAAGFGSIESGSKMLGKALNDPVKGITALSRAGVTFSAEQQERIKGFVEENDLLSAQTMILGEVESQVGGVAAAQATWGDKASVLWGNIQERFGTAILPLLDRAQRWFVQDGGPLLDRWVGVFEDRGIPAIERGVGLIERKALPAIGDFLDDARPLAESVIPAIGSGLGTAADAFEVIAPLAKDVFDAFNDLPDWAKTAIGISAGAAVVAKKAGALDRTSLLGSVVSKAKPLPVFVVNNGIGMGGSGGRGVPPVVPGAPGGGGGPAAASKWGKISGFGSRFIRGLGWGAVGGAGAGAEALEAGGAKPLDLNEYLAEQSRNSRETFDRLLLRPLGKGITDTTTLAGKLHTTLGALDASNADPRVTADGLPAALAGGDRLIGILDQLDHTDARPKLAIQGIESAIAQLDRAWDKFTDFLSFGGSAPAGTSTGSGGHRWNNLKDPRSRNPRVRGPRPPKHEQDGPSGRALTSGSFDDYFDDLAPAAPRPIVIQSILDGRLVSESTLEHYDDMLARL